MGKNANQLLKLAESYLGQGGSTFRKYCGLGAGDPWCCAFVRYIFDKGNDSKLFYNGKNVTYCPTAITWCRANLAEVPLYLALPSDIIFFDWQPNGVPDHIGFVRERDTAVTIKTIEGNTSGGIVAYKTRVSAYVLGVFRPEFTAKFDTTTALVIDGFFGYNSIAMLQTALKKLGYYKHDIDAIMGKNTVKALQKWAGVAQDGAWGARTSKAVQKKLGIKADGLFGPDSAKALQKWANKTAGFTTAGSTAETNDSGSGKQETTTGNSKPKVTLGKPEIKKTQKYLHKKADGVLTSQTKSQAKYYPAITAVEFGEGESATVRRLQATLSVPMTGHLNEETIKAWQTYMKAKADGEFGEKSAEKWIKFLDKPWYEKANLFAEYMSGKMTYKHWDGKDRKTQTCFICNERALNDHHSSQCIGAAFMIWHHGGGLKSKCNYGVISNERWEKLLKAKADDANKMASEWVGIPVKVIRNGGKVLKQSQLKAGDIFALFNGSEYQHTCYYMGEGKLADNTGGRTPNFKANVNFSGRYKDKCKLAIRPVL